MLKALYPLKFHPIFKERIWGGNKLKKVLNKRTNFSNVGESWEISDVDGDVSMVANGNLKGTTINELINIYNSDLVGEKIFNQFKNKFPLLIKFIDAKENLSIQLHPNNQLAAKRHNSFGKTEMWYVMQADEDSKLIVGFNKKVSLEEYKQHIENKTLTSILNFDSVNEGDTYFIEVGRVHAIGAGVMLAEIQQTSDITYRVYDWDRVDDQGNSRELHNDLSFDAIDFDLDNNFRVLYSKNDNIANEMVSCPYFTTNYLQINGKIKKINNWDSFIIYMCVEGEASIVVNNEITYLNKGETLLIPAVIKTFKIESKKAKLLEVYV